eukprot:TRINITY_DN1880_c0_g1_i6.p2 TRINITY_DN1880_c0_g1~~TRINITY_DN1880_c0_g1_i6.p2  ORF type:complete len:134 (+),score=9.01 TRINITY_DN1880_c0_g1_i6:116-517(+)
MRQAGWNPVHNQRLPLLQSGLSDQCSRCWGHHQNQHKGDPHWMDDHEPELGPELAVERGPGGPVPLLQGHRQRPPHLHLLEHRPRRLAVRPDLLRQEFQGLKPSNFQIPAIIFLARYCVWNLPFQKIFLNVSL